MEDNKRCKFDFVAFLAVLILIAFIGCMCVAIAFGIKQQKNLLNVAYADSVQPNDNLLYVSALNSFGYSKSYTSGGFNLGEFYFVDYTVNSTGGFTLCNTWAYNNFYDGANHPSSGLVSGTGIYASCTDPAMYSGLGFPLVSTASAGTYTFSYLLQINSSNVNGATFSFYTYSNGALVELASSQTLSSQSNGNSYSLTFTSIVDFDNLYLRVQPRSGSNYVYNTGSAYRYYFKSVYLSSGTSSFNSWYQNMYLDGYTAGYYTGLAPAGDDFQLDIVGNNLLEYQFNQPWDDISSKIVFDGDTYKGWEIFSAGSALYNYDEVNNLSIFNYYGAFLSYNFDFYYYLDGFDSGDYTFSFNYDYGDIDAYDFKLLALSFTIPETDPVSDENLAYISDDNNDLTLIFSYYNGRYVIRTTCMLSASSNLICRYAKLETGSNFTGFVPIDYYNYGYNQGYQDGQDEFLGSKNYVHIADLDWSSFPPDNFITNFNFNGKQYRFDNYQPSQSLYLGNYNKMGFAYSTQNNTYVGLKFSSSYLYGNIMITMPWVDRGDNSLKLVFEVVETGELLTITNDDSLHWFYNSSSVGKWYIPSEYTSFYDVYNITVSVFFPTQVNIYFLPETDIQGGYSTSEVNSRMAYLCYPYSAEYADIYSTQTSTALSSFDDGFAKGIERGRQEANQANTQAVANARSAGYEEGRRDALADSNDYSFMGLLGAVFDAPIKSFQGLLNFDVLGVNMQSFVLALLSLSVIIIIIKIALGGK